MADFKYRYHDEYGRSGSDAGGPVRPGSIAEDLMERRRMEELQAQLWAQGEAQRTADMQARNQAIALDDIKMSGERQRNRLGLSPIASQLADPASAAWQGDVVDPTGAVPAPYIDISVGGLDGSAPAPLPVVRPTLGLSPLRRTLTPEAKAAQESAASTSSRISLDEYGKRKDLDVAAGQKLHSFKKDKDGFYKLTEAELNALGTGARIQAGAPGADTETIATTYLDDVGNVISKAREGMGSTKDAAPFNSDSQTTGSIKMEVSNDQVVESNAKGTLVKRGDKYIFRSKNGTEKDVTSQVAGRI